MTVGLTPSAMQAWQDMMPRPDEMRRIAEADWVTQWGRAKFIAKWDPARGLFGFLTDLGLPPILQRFFDAVPTTDGELHIWWKGQEMPALKKDWDFTVNPVADFDLVTDWDG